METRTQNAHCAKNTAPGSLPEALEKALDYFCENGCKVSDHGFSRFAYVPGTKQAELLHFLGKAYYTHGVAMQLHLGPIRNQNPRLLAEVGPDAGGDSVGLTTILSSLARSSVIWHAKTACRTRSCTT